MRTQSDGLVVLNSGKQGLVLVQSHYNLATDHDCGLQQKYPGVWITVESLS